jgi:hypothetical protein
VEATHRSSGCDENGHKLVAHELQDVSAIHQPHFVIFVIIAILQLDTQEQRGSENLDARSKHLRLVLKKRTADSNIVRVRPEAITANTVKKQKAKLSKQSSCSCSRGGRVT